MPLHYRIPEPGEEAAMSAIAMAAFASHIAPSLQDDGIEEFRDFAHPASIRARRAATNPGHYQLVACDSTDEPGTPERIVGVAECRGFQHLSMLFVDPAHHRRGIGAALFARIREAILAQPEPPDQITVYSSQFAVPIYERMGFEQTAPAQLTHGIHHVPMVLAL